MPAFPVHTEELGGAETIGKDGTAEVDYGAGVRKVEVWFCVEGNSFGVYLSARE